MVTPPLYAGHGNGDGWTFPTAFDAGMLKCPRARYGNGDLEWLVIAACGPLQPVSRPEDEEKSLAERCGPAFQRLHLLCCYANVSRDNTLAGQHLVEHVVADWTMRQAWMRTAIDIEGSAPGGGVLRGLRRGLGPIRPPGGPGPRPDPRGSMPDLPPRESPP